MSGALPVRSLPSKSKTTTRKGSDSKHRDSTDFTEEIKGLPPKIAQARVAQRIEHLTKSLKAKMKEERKYRK
jgi:hypothetical protein